MTFQTYTVTHQGGRNINQDAGDFKTLANGTTCWVVADGLGGHGGGEVASELAARTILDTFSQLQSVSVDVLETVLQHAQEAILSEQEQKVELKRMRTTIVILVADQEKAQWLHVGDSRLYLFREGALIEQTKDHSVVQSLADSGSISPADIRHHEDRNRILRSLGNEGDLRPTTRATPFLLQSGDAFLLCTDGFWEYVHEIEMQADYAKARTPEEWIHLMEERLLIRIDDENDNFTAIGVFVE